MPEFSFQYQRRKLATKGLRDRTIGQLFKKTCRFFLKVFFNYLTKALPLDLFSFSIPTVVGVQIVIMG